MCMLEALSPICELRLLRPLRVKHGLSACCLPGRACEPQSAVHFLGIHHADGVLCGFARRHTLMATSRQAHCREASSQSGSVLLCTMLLCQCLVACGNKRMAVWCCVQKWLHASVSRAVMSVPGGLRQSHPARPGRLCAPPLARHLGRRQALCQPAARQGRCCPADCQAGRRLALCPTPLTRRTQAVASTEVSLSQLLYPTCQAMQSRPFNTPMGFG